MKNLAFELPFLVLIVSVIYYLYLVSKLFNLLKLNHYQAWVDLGKPSLVINNSISNSVSAAAFIRERRFENLGDDALNIIGNRARRLLVFARAFFYILLAFVLA